MNTDTTKLQDKAVTLSQAVSTEIDAWLKKFPPNQKQSAVLQALRLVQDENGGWLTPDLMDAVADYLDMPRIAVYEVATFYTLYEVKPIARCKISVCTNISCKLQGSDRVVKHLCGKLGVSLGESTPDGRFTLREVECLGACQGAPVLQINDKIYHEQLTPQKVDEILDALNTEYSESKKEDEK